MATAAEVLKEAEDRVSRFVNGLEAENCTISMHPAVPAASRLSKLLMLKMLRLEMPYQSTEPAALEWSIARELKKEAKP